MSAYSFVLITGWKSFFNYQRLHNLQRLSWFYCTIIFTTAVVPFWPMRGLFCGGIFKVPEGLSLLGHHCPRLDRGFVHFPLLWAFRSRFLPGKLFSRSFVSGFSLLSNAFSGLFARETFLINLRWLLCGTKHSVKISHPWIGFDFVCNLILNPNWESNLQVVGSARDRWGSILLVKFQHLIWLAAVNFVCFDSLPNFKCRFSPLGSSSIVYLSYRQGFDGINKKKVTSSGSLWW